MPDVDSPFDPKEFQDAVIEQIHRSETRLIGKLEVLSSQLQEYSKDKAKLARHAHFAPQLHQSLQLRQSLRPSVAPAPKHANSFSGSSESRSLPMDGNDTDSRFVRDHSDGDPSFCLKKMPKTLEVPSSPKSDSKSVWKKLRTKPSEAAKAFVQETLSKAQKRKMTQMNVLPSDGDSRTMKPRAPLAGIDVVLDLNRHDNGVHHVASTATASCWWNPHSENNMWLLSAMKKAEQVRDSVHDVLLAKGWVNQGYQGLSTKHNSYRDMQLSLAERVAENPCFEMCCSFLIILNAILLGWQTQCKVDSIDSGGEDPAWQEVAQLVFTFFFTVEVAFRIYAWRLNFFISKDWGWNIFDLGVVGVSMVELIVLLNSDSSASASNLAGVRVVRILRLVRVVRFIRVVRFFSELRMMIYSSLKAVRPFLWALGILLLIIYMFAIVITQSVSDFRLDHPSRNVNDMLRYYGSLAETVFTLFMVISGGVSWINPAEELIMIHWSFAIWMSLYVSFVVFAVLNIVTGIFIQSAMKSAEADQDLVIQEEMHHQDSLAQGFLEVFRHCDEDNSGYIDQEEFTKHVSDQRVRAFLHHLGLDVAEAQGLFRLLDVGGTGRVYAKEFVIGCQQLKGPAKNVDVATLLYQNKRMMALWAVFMSFVEDQFAIILNANQYDHALSALSTSANTVGASQRNSYASI